MGKKSKTREKQELPFVSICTPTFNRRPFIPYTIKCFNNQDYPKDRLEWIIIDDGTDLIEDLVKDIPQVKYYKYDKKMSLGKKRNIMHEKSKGDIIVYMDDDDYYPSQRVSHAVNMLQTHPNALCAGASEIYIWFKHIQTMYQFGPYNKNHATAGTFAFKRELLKDHRYDDNAALAEEKAFLKNYTVPFVQLEPKKTILVFSHNQNTFDKKKLLANGDNHVQKPSDKKVEEFVKEPELFDFYMNKIDSLLENYKPGDPSNKPDVLKQIKEIEEERKKMNKNVGQIILNQNGTDILLNNDQVVNLLQQQQQHIHKLSQAHVEKDKLLEMLKQSHIEKDKLIEKLQKENNDNQNDNNNNNDNDNNNNIIINQNDNNNNNDNIIINQNDNNNNDNIIINQNGEKTILNNNEILEIIRQQQQNLYKLSEENLEKDKRIENLEKENSYNKKIITQMSDIVKTFKQENN